MKRISLIPDPALAILALLATIVGLFFVFDAGYARSIGSHDGNLIPPEFRSQVTFLLPALFAGFLCSRIKEETWIRNSKWLMLVVIILLVLVMKIGVRQNGAQRWIGVGSFSIQPAEFAKVASVLYLASVFATRKAISFPRRIKNGAHWLDAVAVPQFLRMWPGFVILIVAGLIDAEKDLGTAAVIATAAFLMFIPAGVKTKSLAIAVGLCLFGGWVLVKHEPYRLERITNHADRWSADNVDDNSFQTVQSELAMASGGLTGVGIGNGRAKQVIPATTTDFILATIAEELGLIGALCVLATIAAVVWRLITQAKVMPSKFGSLVLYGIGAWIGVQACVNVMMANGFLPAIGIPLPFISSGGSNLIALWCAIGIAQSMIAASRVKVKKPVEAEATTPTLKRAIVRPGVKSRPRTTTGRVPRRV